MNTHGWTRRRTIPGTLAVALLAGCGLALERRRPERLDAGRIQHAEPLRQRAVPAA